VHCPVVIICIVYVKERVVVGGLEYLPIFGNYVNVIERWKPAALLKKESIFF
jgi:hypothetical protein